MFNQKDPKRVHFTNIITLSVAVALLSVLAIIGCRKDIHEASAPNMSAAVLERNIAAPSVTNGMPNLTDHPICLLVEQSV
jgi:hypothetical protein